MIRIRHFRKGHNHLFDTSVATTGGCTIAIQRKLNSVHIGIATCSDNDTFCKQIRLFYCSLCFSGITSICNSIYYRMEKMSECIGFLLTAQMLFADASEHHEAGRIISEQMELDRAVWYMKSYRKCSRTYKY